MTPTIEGKAQRLIIYIGESDRWRGKPLYAALLETLKAEGIAGATVVRGVAGFGAHSRIHTASILRLSEDLPLRIEAIDSPDKIAEALDVVAPMVSEGLITLEEVQVVRYTHRYLNPLPADVPVSKVMNAEVIAISPDVPVAQAWELMLKHLVKAVPIIDERGQVVGMLTDEDLLNRAGVKQRLSVAERLDADLINQEIRALQSSPLKVVDVMSSPALTVKQDEPLGIAATRMAKRGIKRLPVVDEGGRLVGILSRVDVLRQVTTTVPRSRRRDVPEEASRTVDEVMYPEVPTVAKSDDLAAIVDTLFEFGSRRLIVLDDEQKPIGMISDADVVSRVAPPERHGVLAALRRSGKPPSSQVTAVELMSPGVLIAGPDTSLVEAARRMLAESRKWLVVVDPEGKVLGLVDRQLLLKAMTIG
jgi:CBS domain-containing protein